MKHGYFSLSLCFLLSMTSFISGCGSEEPEAVTDEPEALSRTEFTTRIENFFEYSPLRAGQPSEFLIHLTDLSDGSPVEGAEVVLIARVPGAETIAARTTAQTARVAGIYVAELAIPQPGQYDIEFTVQNSMLTERMLLSDFNVE